MATYYINADTGSNITGTGTSGNPWETLAHAFDNTIAGDTITCQDSTATYAFVNDTFDHNITIQGEQDDASGAVFDGGGAARTWKLQAAITIQRLTIQNVANTDLSPLAWENAPSTAGLTMVNCIIDNVHAPSFTISSGVIGGYQSNQQFVVSLTNTRITNIRRKSGEPATCSVFSTRYPDEATWTFTNVTIEITGVGAESLSHVFRDYGSGTQAITLIMRNVIVSSRGDAVAWTQYAHSGSSSHTYSCFNNITSSPAGAGNITDDPLFVDPDNGDFRLRPDSPCIDTGVII